MSNLAEKLAGKFIVLDGPDGSGKTTQLSMLHEYLLELGGKVELVRDPGGTEIGEKIRNLLLDTDNSQICPMCETLLFMASRAQLIEQRIKPALQKGMIVLCDRFISATIAYQGAAGIEPETIIKLGEIIIGNTWPDLTIILDVPIEVCRQRIGLPEVRWRKSGELSAPPPPLFGDRMETKDLPYHQDVLRIFEELEKYYPRPVVRINGDRKQEIIFKDILDILEKVFTQTQTEER